MISVSRLISACAVTAVSACFVTVVSVCFATVGNVCFVTVVSARVTPVFASCHTYDQCVCRDPAGSIFKRDKGLPFQPTWYLIARAMNFLHQVCKNL